MRSELILMIRTCLEEMNAKRPNPINLEQVDLIELFGDEGVFDSMHLVNFLLLLEEKIEEQLDRSISLTSERAVSRQVSPFRNVANLVEFIQEEFDEGDKQAA
jgi:acyl carrier protein